MTLDTSTSANKSSPQSINVIKKSRNEVIKTIQEIAKVDEVTINQAIEACLDNEGRYSMDTVLNILMDEKNSFEQKNRDNKCEGTRFSRQYGVSPTSNDDSNKPSAKKNHTISDSHVHGNLEEEDDDDYEQMANLDSRDHRKLKSLDTEIMREEGKPCGLRNVGNTCWFNSIIQSLFHLPGFREIIFSFRLTENEILKLDAREKNMVLFVAELRKLFALMLKSKRRIINPNQTLKCLKNCSKFDCEMSNQEDVSEFMTILVNIIEESFEKLNILKQSQSEEKPIIETENIVSKINELNIKPTTEYRSESKNVQGPKKSKNNPIVNLLDGEIVVKRKDSDVKSESSNTDIFREVNIQMLNSRNLHAGLELEWGETLIDKQNISGETNEMSNSGINESGINRSIYQQESWVKKLPRVLFICLNRYKFVQATQSSSKILEPFEFYQEIYLDRYLDENKEIIIKKRKEVKLLREELKNLENKLNSIKKFPQESGNTMQLDEAFKCVLNFITTDYTNDEIFQQIKPVSSTSEDDSNKTNSLKNVEEILKNWINRTQNKIDELNEAIIKITHKIDTAFDENYLKKHRYNLHSVCIHEGTSTSGHFWTYIWNSKKEKWFKYNDTEVCETSWEDVYANSIGGLNQNNLNQPNDLNDLSNTKTRTAERIPSAYFLIYTKADDSTLYQETKQLDADIEEFLKNDCLMLENKLNKLKYKRILDDLLEILNKTNEQIAQHKISTEQNSQTCLEHAKAFHDSTLEALMAGYDKISVSTGVMDHSVADEALKFAIDHELKKYTQSKSEIEEKLPEVDIRMNHILIYANANMISTELKHIALLDLFRMPIFQDSDVRLKIMQTLAQVKYNEYILKPYRSPGQASPGTIPIMKHYENFLNDYRDYRSIIAAFINAVNFMDSQRFEDAAQFFCVACEYNERIISSLNLKMKGMHHNFLLDNRRKCLKIWNESTIRKFTFKNSRMSNSTNFDDTGARLQQLNQQDLNSLIETMINKFLPCFFRLFNSTNEDKAMIEVIRQDWLNVLDSNLPGIQLFHDFMTKLFEEPVSSHYHSLNVNKTNLQNRYHEAVQLVKNI